MGVVRIVLESSYMFSFFEINYKLYRKNYSKKVGTKHTKTSF